MILMAGCRESPHPVLKAAKEASITVTDFTGQELFFDRPPERVVCLIESALSGLYMLQVQSKVVAVPGDVYKGKTFQYYSQLDEKIKERSLPAPGNWDFINIEQIVALRPDLVMIWASQTEAIDNLQQFGIPVYSVMLHDFEDVFKELRDFGKIFGCTARTDSLVSFTRTNLEKTKAAHKTSDPMSVYFMWAQGINETSGRNSTVEELLNYAGVRNVCDLDQEHVTVSMEKLIEWNPGMIVMWYNEKLDPEDILKNPVLQGLDAIRNRMVYELPEVFTCDFWTLKMQYPAKVIAAWAYPQQYMVFDRDAELEDLFGILYGKEIKVNE
jgi:iron complex transport system substrate-binding protein